MACCTGRVQEKLRVRAALQQGLCSGLGALSSPWVPQCFGAAQACAGNWCSPSHGDR